jgi:GNAT superfamily N-acetyltransferase
MVIETLSENSTLLREIYKLHAKPWPLFLGHDEIVKKYWRPLIQKFPIYQLLCRLGHDYVGVGNAAPIFWNGVTDDLPSGFDEATKNIMEKPTKLNTLCGLAIVVSESHHGKGISSFILKSFIQRAAEHGFSYFILPVRPTLKCNYPTIPIEHYIEWRVDDKPFDPWLRVHVSIGGEILKIAHNSMIVTGTIAEWQEWTGMHFGESGRYVVPGALTFVDIDVENDTGTYVEPNVWVRHICIP